MSTQNKIQSAKAQIVYTFDENGVYEISLFDHVMQSARKTTTPHGVDYIDYVQEVEGEAPIKWELRKWIGHGSKSMLIAEYDNEDDAMDSLWEARMNDFDADDQRFTAYWATEGDAQAEFITAFPKGHYILLCESENKRFYSRGEDVFESITIMEYNAKNKTSYITWDDVNDDDIFTVAELKEYFDIEEIKFI